MTPGARRWLGAVGPLGLALMLGIAIVLLSFGSLARGANPIGKAKGSTATTSAQTDDPHEVMDPTAGEDASADGKQEAKEEEEQGPSDQVAGSEEGAGSSSFVWKALVQVSGGATDFVTNNKWPLIILMFLVLYRRSVSRLLSSLERRGFSVDVAQFKMSLNEVTTEAPLPAAAFAPSPLELEPPVSEKTAAGAVLRDLRPQLTVPVSGTVARAWRNTAQGGPPTDQMIAKRGALEKACREDAPNLPALLFDFCQALEASRYLDAGGLLDLYEHYSPLREAVDARKAAPKTARDRLMLCCVGTALAQRGQWKEAVDALTPIVETGAQPSYLPAADMYLIARYNRAIEITVEDWPDFDNLMKSIQPDLDRCVKAMDGTDWATFEVAPSSARYYRRELPCAIGTILSLIAEFPGASRAEFLEQAEEHLRKCTETIDGEAPTTRDFNNLADLYRQRKLFDKGLAEIDKALRCEPPDPMVFETRAQLLHDSERYLESLLAIQGYTREQTVNAAADDLAQYVRNQMLYAKLLYRTIERTGMGEIDSVIQVLESVRQFLEARSEAFGSEEYRNLRVELVEMLGYAYLARGGAVEKAESVFHAADVNHPERDWRRKVALARGHLASSRYERRDLSPRRALHHLGRAKQLLLSTSRWRTDFPMDGPESQWRRSRRLRSHLDTLAANVELAEECLQVGELSEAQKLAEGPIDGLIHDVEANLGDKKVQEALAPDLETVRETLGRLEALKNFILGRALLRMNPLAADLTAFDRATQHLVRARALNPKLTALVGVETGFALVNAAFHGEGALVSRYDRGIAALEDAVRCGDAATRTEALRVLAGVYGQRALIERRQSNSGSK